MASPSGRDNVEDCKDGLLANGEGVGVMVRFFGCCAAILYPVECWCHDEVKFWGRLWCSLSHACLLLQFGSGYSWNHLVWNGTTTTFCVGLISTAPQVLVEVAVTHLGNGLSCF